MLPTRIDSRITAYINAGFFNRPEGLKENNLLILPIFLYPWLNAKRTHLIFFSTPLNDCKAFASVLNQAYKEKLLGKQAEQRTILRLANGSTLTLISSNINAQAGKRGSRILDEFALHEDPEALYNVAYPGITWGGQLEIISTHRGAHNFFNRLIEEARNGNPKNISLHRVTLADALEQGFLQKLKAKLPPDDPRQEMDESTYYNFIKNS